MSHVRQYQPVRKIEPYDDTTLFDCGNPALNQFLQRFALLNRKANSAQTYICCELGSNKVVGFYSLAVGSIEQATAADRITRGLARHPVPVMILARLAIDAGHQGAGLGRALLNRALKNVMRKAGYKAHGAQRPRHNTELGEEASTAQRRRWPPQ